MIEMNNLFARVVDTDKDILKGFSLTVKPGEVHAIMGPNGSGKSTLSKVVAGHPGYELTQGSILLNGEDVVGMSSDQRANAGIFMAFQYPVEIPGVRNGEFLRMAYNAKQKALGLEEVDPLDFQAFLEEKLALIDMADDFLSRDVNHGFSGGEKKRNEILQLLVLEPKVIFLDETDSGLDIDALRAVAKAVNVYHNPTTAFVVITHYQRLLSHIVPDYVHVMSQGKLIQSGDKSLAMALEQKGYEWLVNA